MSETSKVALAVVGGYLLGRRKKLKLAIGLGAYLAGKKLNLNPAALAKGVTGQLGNAPGVGMLKDQVRGELLNAGKAAATTVSNQLVQGMADNLQQRTERVRQSIPGAPDLGGQQDEEADQRQSARAEATRDEEPAAKSGSDESAEQRAAPAKDAPSERRSSRRKSTRSDGGEGSSETAGRARRTPARTGARGSRANGEERPTRTRRSSSSSSTSQGESRAPARRPRKPSNRSSES